MVVVITLFNICIIVLGFIILFLHKEIKGMNMYKCVFCGKEYKSEKGLTKHLEKCEKKKRYEMLEINPELYANMNLLCNRLYSKKFNNPATNQKLFMANEKNFKKINDFTDYCLKVGVYSQQDFLMYLLANGISINKWCEEKHLINFLYDWLYHEDEKHAIDRSIKYLNDRNLTMETISPYRLYLALRYGNISIKYLKSINYNWEKNVDCDSDELFKLKYFLRG